MPNEQIRLIEELAFNAWPASVVQIADGWRLRFYHGVTRRANAVWPNAVYGDMDMESRLRIAEDFYARRGARPIFQICPAAQPSGLADALLQCGYTPSAHTSVQVVQLDALASSAESKFPGQVSVGDLDESWFDTYAEGEGMSQQTRALRRDILERIGPRAGFALARLDGQPVAVGMGVVERGWCGVYCVETFSAHRRQGAGGAIMAALAAWSQAQGATQMYLQVMLNNTAALATYARAGFRQLYTYHHWLAPEGGS
ncbi:MAG: GNAT family N-acetyltransferase [Chloroflexi bacterium]|nr:GNAT family N-acetyltransferase [Chloroflexota bacterium]